MFLVVLRANAFLGMNEEMLIGYHFHHRVRVQFSGEQLADIFRMYLSPDATGAGLVLTVFSFRGKNSSVSVESLGTIVFECCRIRRFSYSCEMRLVPLFEWKGMEKPLRYNLRLTWTYCLGKSSAIGGSYFNGYIQYFRIYNSALESYEVAKIYQDTRPTVAPVAPTFLPTTYVPTTAPPQLLSHPCNHF